MFQPCLRTPQDERTVHFHLFGTNPEIWSGADPTFKLVDWWFQPTPLKNDGVKVSWDDDIPKIWKNKNHVPNHQPGVKSSVFRLGFL